MKREEFPTPIPENKAKSHERRITSLEEQIGRIVRELSELTSRVKVLYRRTETLELNQVRPREKEDSETNISISPQKIRMGFKNSPIWTIVVIAFATVIIVWLLTK